MIYLDHNAAAPVLPEVLEASRTAQSNPLSMATGNLSTSMARLIRLLICLPICLPLVQAEQKPLETIKGCTFAPYKWADGDSFQIATPSGEIHTVRLYCVDCLELHLGGDRNRVRLREQRRYFGITDAGMNEDESVDIAISLAKEAADFTAKCLQRPFTLHTRYADGGGDANFKRILGFITLSDGRDLGSMLVKQGLARAKGTNSAMPNGISLVETKGMLEDFEIQALKKDRGIWAKTNWDTLPVERQRQRKEDAEDEIAKARNTQERDFKIDPNQATKEELIKLEGIGDTLADRIIQERRKAPFLKAEDLLKVKGLTNKTLVKIRQHLVFTKP